MTCADESSDTFSPSKDMFGRTFDLLGISYAGSVEATGCTGKGVVKDESMEKAVKLAESLI
jgi:hypothetical protein